MGTTIACFHLMQNHQKVNAWDRFESLLAAMSPGDVITVNEAASETELSMESVRVVMEALTRADLFEQHGEHFLRVGVSAPHLSTKHWSA